MRRAAFATIAVLVLTGSLAGMTAGNDSNTVYLALGDSLAWGDGASVPDHTAYVPRLAGYFSGGAHGDANQLINLAIRGETTDSFLAGQLAQAIAVINDPTTDVRVVTISIGGNDLLNLLNEPTDPCVQDPGSPTCQALLFAAMQNTAANYPVILGALQAALAADPGTERVFVMTLYNPFGGTGSPYEVPVDGALLGADGAVDCGANGNPFNVGLNDIMACTAVATGGIVVDGYAAIGDNALELTHIGEPGFNIHPNDDGYAILAQAHRRADRAA
jgi:lysophospholipase L1-like esterase